MQQKYTFYTVNFLGTLQAMHFSTNPDIHVGNIMGKFTA